MEGLLTYEDISKVIQDKYKIKNYKSFEVIEWTFKRDGYSSGFYGVPSREYVSVKFSNDQIIGMHLFVRRTPLGNRYHRELLSKMGVFSKEVILYNGLLKEIRKYFEIKIYPLCYLGKINELIVLEDLSISNYSCISPNQILNLEQIESVLRSLAQLHATSILFEEETGMRLDELYPQALKETYYVMDLDHPWFHNGCTSMNAIETIVEAYFPHILPQVYERAYDIIRTLPFRISPSRKYRNVLCHGGVSASVVLFRDPDEPAVLTGFGHARYNTPALDVLLAIYMTTNSNLRSVHNQSLFVHYYNHLSRCLSRWQIDVRTFLSWDQFLKSLHEAKSLALAMTVVHLHLLLLPQDKTRHILQSQELYQQFIEQDRNELVLELMRNNNVYRKRITQILTEFFNHVKTNKKMFYN